MANITLNTRTQLKYDTYNNWHTINPTPLKGEVCVVVVPASTGAVAQEPAILFKVGDGTSNFQALPFAAAKAADVYDWAKAASKPAYTASEISGLDEFIAGEIQDTNTTYKIEVDTENPRKFTLYAKELDGSFTAQNTITIPAETVYTLVEGTTNGTVKFNGVDVPVHGLGSAAYSNTSDFDAAGSKDDAIAAAQQAGDNAQADVDALSAKIGTVAEGKTVVEMISDAQEAATYDDTELTNRVGTVEGKVTTLIGSDVSKSARAIAAEEVAKIVAGAGASYDTLKEIADWISNHTTDAAAMNSAILALQAIVEGIGGESEQPTVVAYVDAAIAALNIGDYATAAQLTALAGRVTTLEGTSHSHSNKTVLDGIDAQKVSAWDAKVDESDLSAIATSGNVNDLTQTEGDYIILNCGSASEVI